MHNVSVVFCAFALAVASRTWAADFFVAPHGDDGSAGTEAQPFATLQAAVNRGSSGNSVGVE